MGGGITLSIMLFFSLRRELKRLIRQHPEMNFLDFLDEAILYSEDEEKSKSTRKVQLHSIQNYKKRFYILM